MNSLLLPFAFGFALIFSLNPASAQQMDMDAMLRWGKADLISYHIVGEYSEKTAIASDGFGRADVTDRAEIDLTWKLSGTESGTNLVGTPTIKNFRSEVKNVRDAEPSCLPPILKGEYEHYTISDLKPGMAGALEMQVETTYPVVEVAQFCTASRRSVPARRKIGPEEFVVPSPMLFAMPLPSSEDLSISADKKSLIVKKSGWTWTFTPTIEEK